VNAVPISGGEGQRGSFSGNRDEGNGAMMEMPWHWYDLQRGMTSARIEGVVGDKVGRWVGIITGRRTVREYLFSYFIWQDEISDYFFPDIFATNPYGGIPTRAHLTPKIRNATQLVRIPNAPFHFP